MPFFADASITGAATGSIAVSTPDVGTSYTNYIGVLVIGSDWVGARAHNQYDPAVCRLTPSPGESDFQIGATFRLDSNNGQIAGVVLDLNTGSTSWEGLTITTAGAISLTSVIGGTPNLRDSDTVSISPTDVVELWLRKTGNLYTGYVGVNGATPAAVVDYTYSPSAPADNSAAPFIDARSASGVGDTVGWRALSVNGLNGSELSAGGSSLLLQTMLWYYG